MFADGKCRKRSWPSSLWNGSVWRCGVIVVWCGGEWVKEVINWGRGGGALGWWSSQAWLRIRSCPIPNWMRTRKSGVATRQFTKCDDVTGAGWEYTRPLRVSCSDNATLNCMHRMVFVGLGRAPLVYYGFYRLGWSSQRTFPYIPLPEIPLIVRGCYYQETTELGCNGLVEE